MRLIYVFFLLMEDFLTDVIYSPENTDYNISQSGTILGFQHPYLIRLLLQPLPLLLALLLPDAAVSWGCLIYHTCPVLLLPTTTTHTPVAACQSPAGNRCVLPCTGGVLSARIVHPCPFLLHQPCSALLHRSIINNIDCQQLSFLPASFSEGYLNKAGH